MLKFVVLSLLFLWLVTACVRVAIDEDSHLEVICCANGTYLLKNGMLTSLEEGWGHLWPEASATAGSAVQEAGSVGLYGRRLIAFMAVLRVAVH